MLKISLSFKKFTNFAGQATWEFLGLRMWNFQGIAFTWTQTYKEILKSALVFLYFVSKLSWIYALL